MSWMDEDHRLWSQYRFITQLLKAKRDYYKSGTSKLTDHQYDSLEDSFILLHGRSLYDNVVGVGYIEGSLEKYEDKLKELNGKIKYSKSD